MRLFHYHNYTTYWLYTTHNPGQAVSNIRSMRFQWRILYVFMVYTQGAPILNCITPFFPLQTQTHFKEADGQLPLGTNKHPYTGS